MTFCWIFHNGEKLRRKVIHIVAKVAQLKFVLLIDRTENIGISLKEEILKVDIAHPWNKYTQIEKCLW